MLGLQGRSRAHVTPSPEFKVSCSRVSELAGYRQRWSAAVRVGVGAGGMRGGQFGGGVRAPQHPGGIVQQQVHSEAKLSND